MTPHDQDLVAEQYVPSPSEPVRDQVARHEATGGREGGTLEGRPVVVTMTGASSGKIRKTVEAWELVESRWPHFPEYRAKEGRKSQSWSSNR